MDKLISIGLSPNVTRDDVKTAFRTLLHPRLWFRYEETTLLRQSLSTNLQINPDRLFLTISGRTAVYYALKALGIGTGDEVIVQGFTCVAIVNPILWLSAKPVYVDVDSKTLNSTVVGIREKITPQTRAIIVQHTFGLPADDLLELKKYATERKIAVIEDCAHSFGAEIQGQKVGTIGDFGILSFGRDKLLSSVFGGGLVVNNQQYLEQIKKITKEEIPAASTWIIKQLLHPIITWFVLKTYHIELGKIIQLMALKLGILSKATSDAEKRIAEKPEWIEWQYPNALAKLTLNHMETLIKELNRRTEIATIFSQNGVQSIQPFSSNLSQRVWLRYGVWVENPIEIQRYFKTFNIVLGDWYNQVVAPEGVNLEYINYLKGTTQIAEEICQHIINLPVHPRLSNEEISRILDVWKSFQSRYNTK